MVCVTRFGRKSVLALLRASLVTGAALGAVIAPALLAPVGHAVTPGARTPILDLLAPLRSAGRAMAGPVDDAQRAAEAIQALLDAGKPAEAEPLARAALAAAVAAKGARSAEAANLGRLLGDTLFDQHRYDEAERHFRAALDIRAAVLGPDHLDTARSAGDLAANLKAAKRFGEAETFYRQALAIRLKALGPGHRDVLRSQWRLALVIDDGGRLAEAATLLDEVVAAGVTGFGPDDPLLASALMDLGAIRLDLDDRPAAEDAYRRALSIREAALTAGDGAIADSRRRLAGLLRGAGRAAEARTLYEAALAADEKALGTADPRLAVALSGLASQFMLDRDFARAEPLYARAADLLASAAPLGAAKAIENHALALRELDRLTEAEARYRAALALRRAAGDASSADAVTTLLHLANLVARGDRPVEAETLYKQALAAGLAGPGGETAVAGFAAIFLGQLYFGQNRLDEAEPLLTRGIAIMEKQGGDPALADAARATLTMMMAADGRFAEAAELFGTLAVRAERAGDRPAHARYQLGRATMLERLGDVDGADQALAAILPELEKGKDAVVLADALATLGDVRRGQGRLAEARAVYGDVIARRSALFGADNRATLSTIVSLALVDAAGGDDRSARDLLERFTTTLDRQAAANAAAADNARVGRIEDRALSAGAVYDYLVKTYYRLADSAPDQREALAGKAFLVAQRVIESQAAGALAQMAARQAAGDGPLAGLLRERQDLVAEWQARDRALTARRAGATRDAAAEAADEEKLVAIDARIRELDGRIGSEFPDFAALQRPAPLDVAAVQAALGEDEVLLFYADTNRMNERPFETYLWAVPKQGAPRFIALERPTGQISAAVRQLRGLMGVGGDTRGARTLGGGQSTDRTGEVLQAAHEIYKAVLAPAADLIAGKSLVVVPSRKLATLPFQLLVARLPANGSADRYRDAGWLARDHAITVLPSVAALATTSGSAQAAGSGRVPYLAFANPLLTGRGGDDRRAEARGGCAAPAVVTALVAGGEAPDLAALYRGGSADVAAVRALPPLPETADEVCAVASTLGVDTEAVRLGAAATEASVKDLSESGDLARAAILHFATHGLVSGELAGQVEPAIVLTPPDIASRRDDGLLTASEVTTLKLDADWVILSACNTAAGEGGGEALSGLARAFFYAGARALLVSHWPVNSDAAVNLVTSAVGEMTAHPGLDRAEALRRAMVGEIARGGRHADPASWAPFVLVGARD